MIICFMPSLADRMRRPVFEVAAAREAAVEAAATEPDEDAACFEGEEEDGLLPPPGEAAIPVLDERHELNPPHPLPDGTLEHSKFRVKTCMERVK